MGAPEVEAFLSSLAVAGRVSASDPDGTVAKVEFFADGAKVGEATNSPYTLAWNSPALGGHVLRAVATDNKGDHGSLHVASVIIQGVF